ncbi:MAG: isochorismatase family cysteine hydrolase [bacterium]
MALPPLSPNSLHLVVDMQRLFAEDHGWHVPDMARILPNVLRLCQTSGANTVYSRFLTPGSPDAAHGRWQALYRTYHQVTGLPAAIFDLVPDLSELAVQGTIFDKTTYSLFAVPAFLQHLTKSATDTVVFSGAETDACVYASLLAAVDMGLRVVVACDAVTSGDLAAHQTMLDILGRRLPDQVELSTTDDVIRAWAK